MPNIAQDVEVAIVGNSNAWNTHTAETIGATHGALPLTMPEANQKGTVVFDDSVGQQDAPVHKLLSESTEKTLTTYMRWNGPEWQYLAHIIGDDTKTGVSFPFIHTMNWQREPALNGITRAYRINDDNNLIYEIPHEIPTSFTLQNIDGFLGASVTCLNDTTLTGANATNGSTQFGNLTYNTTDSCILYNQMTLYLNGQAAGDPTSGTAISDFFDLSLTIARPYDSNDDVARGFAAASTARRRAKPQWTGAYPEITLQFNTKDADLTTHIDDFHSENEYKAEILFSEAIGGNTHTLTIELGRLKPFDPTVEIVRSARIGMQHNFRCIKPSSTPTGFATANEMHVIMNDNFDVTYETLT